MKPKLLYSIYILSGAVILQAAIHDVSMRNRDDSGSSLAGKDIRCAIQIDRSERNFPGLTIGYNYELLRRFAAANADSVVSIVNAEPDESWIDSLKKGSVDIVIVPYEDSLQVDSILFSSPIDNMTVWAVNQKHGKGLEEIDRWIDSISRSEDFEDMRNSFLNRYNPAKRAQWGRISRNISPYDDLIREQAAAIGWDWRMLAAVVYQESKFHIEAKSPRGARGLLQIMPQTGERFGVTDLFSPEENLKAGASFLGWLQEHFARQASNKEELVKFTLAAYNAGVGRINDCIRHTDNVGGDSSTWDGLVATIPEMRDSLKVQADTTIKLGTFQGWETIAYVDRVLSLYDNFKVICPQK